MIVIIGSENKIMFNQKKNNEKDSFNSGGGINNNK